MTSFGRQLTHALRGLTTAYTHERQFRIEVLCAGIALLLAAIFPLTAIEFILVVLACVSVLTLELVNTSLEYCLDAVDARLSAHVKAAKDCMAGAVLMTAIGAAVLGLVVFVPHLGDVLWLLIGAQ